MLMCQCANWLRNRLKAFHLIARGNAPGLGSPLSAPCKGIRERYKHLQYSQIYMRDTLA